LPIWRRSLAGFLVVKEITRPLTVRLGPAGAIKGYLSPKNGLPVRNGKFVGIARSPATPAIHLSTQLGLVPGDARPTNKAVFQMTGVLPA